MKAILKSIFEALAVILLVPQLFVFLYFFWPTVRGVDGWDMMKTLIALGFSVSRLAGPILYILYLVIVSVNRDKRQCVLSFVICFVTGYASVIAWNLFVYKNFSYAWGVLPVLICSLGAAAYQLFKDASILAKPKPELFLANDV